jgi:hypothetical protein
MATGAAEHRAHPGRIVYRDFDGRAVRRWTLPAAVIGLS